MRQRLIAILALVLSLVLPSLSQAAVKGLAGYAWSSNIGWIKFSGSNYGVRLDTSTKFFAGYAWSPNVGWIRFGENIGRQSNSYPSDPQHGAKLTVNNRIVGWARVCSVTSDSANCRGSINPWADGWDGWIKFAGSGSGYDVHLTKNGCVLRGWAWGSDVLGWIHFPARGVHFTDCTSAQVNKPDGNDLQPEPEPTSTPPIVNLPTCDFSASPAQVAKGGRVNLNWDCHGTAASCSIEDLSLLDLPGVGSIRTGPLQRTTNFILTCSNNDGSVDFTAQAKVLRPSYCEVIPFIGACR